MGLKLPLYKMATRLAGPALPLVLSRRLKAGKEDPARVSERMGRTAAARPAGSLVWFHAASVGESVMLLPLIERLISLPSTGSVLLTTQTRTAAELMAERLPAGAQHQYAVLDTPKTVARFLDHWQPELAIFAESEIWPNMIGALWARHIPLALINARMSEKSLIGWDNSTGKDLFSKFAKILPGDGATAKGLSNIMGKDIPAIGNLKYAGEPLPVDEARLAAFTAQSGTRPIWSAVSTHAGEDEIVLAAHAQVLKQHPDALLILVPRHPERGPDIAALVTELFGAQSQTQNAEAIPPQSRVCLLPEMGVLGLAFRAAPVSLIGGSLLPTLSGHNPLEAARLRSAVLSGPHVNSFTDIYSGLSDAHGLQTVTAAQDIAGAVVALWSVENARRALCDNAEKFAASQDRVLDDVWTALLPLIPS